MIFSPTRAAYSKSFEFLEQVPARAASWLSVLTTEVCLPHKNCGSTVSDLRSLGGRL